MKRMITDQKFIQAVAKCKQLGFIAQDGKLRDTDCADVETLVLILKSLPAARRRNNHRQSDNFIKSGIYTIINTVTGERYIGSSNNISSRFVKHRSDLRRGTHHSASLQSAWNSYGEDEFIFFILEEVLDSDELESVEQVYLNNERPSYNNTATATNFSNYPPLEESLVHRLIIFLREQAEEITNGPLSQFLQFLFDHDIVYPGPNTSLVLRADLMGINTWEDFKGFLLSDRPNT